MKVFTEANVLKTMHGDINAKFYLMHTFLNQCITSLTFYADAPSELSNHPVPDLHLNKL